MSDNTLKYEKGECMFTYYLFITVTNAKETEEYETMLGLYNGYETVKLIDRYFGNEKWKVLKYKTHKQIKFWKPMKRSEIWSIADRIFELNKTNPKNGNYFSYVVDEMRLSDALSVFEKDAISIWENCQTPEEAIRQLMEDNEEEIEDWNELYESMQNESLYIPIKKDNVVIEVLYCII